MNHKFINLAKVLGRATPNSDQDNEPSPSGEDLNTTWTVNKDHLQKMLPLDEMLGALEKGSALEQAIQKNNQEAALELKSKITEFADEGKMKLALQLAEYMTESMRELVGDHHTHVIESVLYTGQLQYKLRNFDKAVEAAQQGLALLEASTNAFSVEAIYFHQLLGTIAYERANPAEAIGPYEQALKISQHINDAREQVNTLLSLSRAYRSLGQFSNAEKTIIALIQIEQQQTSPQELTMAIAFNEMGSILADQSNYEEALPLVEKALEIRRLHLPPSAPEIVASLNNATQIYELLGEGQKAETAGHELGILLQEDHPNYLPIQNESVKRLISFDNLIEAESVLQKILFPTAREFGRSSLRYAKVCENWGRIKYLNENYPSAQRAYQRALKIREKVFGKGALDSIYTLALLAQLDASSGSVRQDQAIQTLEICQQQLEKNHESHSDLYAEVSHLLGSCYLTQRQFDLALKSYQTNLSILIAICGEHHYRVAVAKNNIGVTYLYLNDLTKAEELLMEAFSVAEQNLGTSHRDTLAIAGNLAAAKIELEQFDLAEELIESTMEHTLQQGERGVSSYTRMLNNLGCLQKGKQQYEMAMMTYRKAQLVAKEKLPEDRYLAAILMHNLATCSAALMRFKQAKSEYGQALQILEPLFGDKHAEVLEIKMRLEEVDRSMKTGQPLVAHAILTFLTAA